MSAIYRRTLAVGFPSATLLHCTTALAVAFDPDPTGDPKYGNYDIDAK